MKKSYFLGNTVHAFLNQFKELAIIKNTRRWQTFLFYIKKKESLSQALFLTFQTLQ